MTDYLSVDTPGVMPMTGLDLKDKVLVLDVIQLDERYKKPRFQLWHATGGFGCSPNTIGTAVFSYCLADNEVARWERFDFIGIASEELVNSVMEYDKTTIDNNYSQ